LTPRNIEAHGQLYARRSKILLIEKTSSGEEVMPMYVTLSELLAVLTLIAFVISIVLDANNNKKN
jgi:hypothetical protein